MSVSSSSYSHSSRSYSSDYGWSATAPISDISKVITMSSGLSLMKKANVMGELSKKFESIEECNEEDEIASVDDASTGKRLLKRITWSGQSPSKRSSMSEVSTVTSNKDSGARIIKSKSWSENSSTVTTNVDGQAQTSSKESPIVTDTRSIKSKSWSEKSSDGKSQASSKESPIATESRSIKSKSWSEKSSDGKSQTSSKESPIGPESKSVKSKSWSEKSSDGKSQTSSKESPIGPESKNVKSKSWSEKSSDGKSPTTIEKVDGQTMVQTKSWSEECPAVTTVKTTTDDDGSKTVVRSHSWSKKSGYSQRFPPRSHSMSTVKTTRRLFEQDSSENTIKETSNEDGVWSPNQGDYSQQVDGDERICHENESLDIKPVWKPNSYQDLDRKPQYRSVKLETTMKTQTNQDRKSVDSSVINNNELPLYSSPPISTSSTVSSLSGSTIKLPPSQSPTVTLLKKAREGQLRKSAMYIDEAIHHENEEIPRGAVLYDKKTSYDGGKIHTDTYYVVPMKSQSTSTFRTIHQEPKKYEGIGPITGQGIPVSLRTKVKDENVSDWYKQMYNSLHKVNHHSSKPSYSSHPGTGYMSEPEFDRDDDEYRRQKNSTISRTYERHLDEKYNLPGEHRTFLPKDSYRSEINPYLPNNEPVYASHDVYKHQPKSIINYEPGSSSIVEREHKLNSRSHRKSNKNLMLGSFRDGYESDTTLLRKSSEQLHPLSPQEQHVWYKEIQRGGDIPLAGLRKTVPEKPKESPIGPIHSPSPSYSYLSTTTEQRNERRSCTPPPKPEPPSPHLLSNYYYTNTTTTQSTRSTESPHKFQESEVNIHYRTPIRSLEKIYIEEEELRQRQQEAMKNYYDEERRKKQLKEWAENEARKHSDFLLNSEKSPLPYNRYEGIYNPSASDLRLSVSPTPSNFIRIETRTVARALYDFKPESHRELPFTKGDLIIVTKKIDKNWYEGEHHGMAGMFPVSYVEVIPPETLRPVKKKIVEGQAKVIYRFSAQTPVELSLLKGEVVNLIRRVDDNWWEGRLGTKTGIFPASYVKVVKEPRVQDLRSSASSQPPKNLQNGYRPTFISMLSESDARQSSPEVKRQVSSSENALQVDTRSEPEPYKVLFSYHPINDDELELQDGDTVYVMEKCDDGWFVGTSMRTGLFGTFPGNYVEKM
ncbi:SORBS2 (predicted) [Pycnogonum litorale]